MNMQAALSNKHRHVLANVLNHGPRTYRAGMKLLETQAVKWSGRWYLYRAEVDGQVYWPVLGRRDAALAGWDMVCSLEYTLSELLGGVG